MFSTGALCELSALFQVFRILPLFSLQLAEFGGPNLRHAELYTWLVVGVFSRLDLLEVKPKRNR